MAVSAGIAGKIGAVTKAATDMLCSCAGCCPPPGGPGGPTCFFPIAEPDPISMPGGGGMTGFLGDGTEDTRPGGAGVGVAVGPVDGDGDGGSGGSRASRSSSSSSSSSSETSETTETTTTTVRTRRHKRRRKSPPVAAPAEGEGDA